MIKLNCTDILSLLTKQDLLKLLNNNSKKSTKKELLITSLIKALSLDPLTDSPLINLAIKLNISNDFIDKINILPLNTKFFWIKQEIINMNSGIIKESRLVGQPVVFDFYSNWDSLVKPYLFEPYVRDSLNIGMEDLELYYKDDGILSKNYKWYPTKAPYTMSQSDMIYRKAPKLHSLNWYSPLQCCHWIAPFSLALGELIYPELEWKYRHSRRHTIAIGYEKNMSNVEIPVVIFDILNYHLQYDKILDCSDSTISCIDYSRKWEDGKDNTFKFSQNKLIS